MRLLLGLLAAAALSADPLMISTFGSFDSSAAPTTAFSAPGAAWALSFTVDRNPTPSELVVHTDLFGGEEIVGFAVPAPALTYTLNGNPVPAPGALVMFFNETNGGLFTVRLDPGTASDPMIELSLYGAQVFTGAFADPTLVPGSYMMSYVPYLFITYPLVDPDKVHRSISREVVDISAASVPEPGARDLMGITAVFLAAILLRRRWRGGETSRRSVR